MTCPPAIVVDTSVLIEFKLRVPADRQWDLAKQMEVMVQTGVIRFPPHVWRELRGNSHIDIPEAWAMGVRSAVHSPVHPTYEAVERVMSVAPLLIEADSEGDPADPYVIALALDLEAGGFEVCVATHDTVDRLPLKSSMKSACELLGLRFLPIDDFIACVEDMAGLR